MSGMQPSLKIGEAAATRLERYMHSTIPQVVQMQVKVRAVEAGWFTLSAPLGPNINHEQTAFGGSIVSLGTLACWGHLWLLLEDQPHMHIVVNEAHIRYLRPVTTDLMAHCVAPSTEVQQRFLDTLARRGKARMELKAAIGQDGVIAAEYTGSFVAYREEETSA